MNFMSEKRVWDKKENTLPVMFEKCFPFVVIFVFTAA